MMDMNEAAAAMNGSEYGSEGTREFFAELKEAGLVAVFGASDDLTEFRGGIDDEAGAYDGADHRLNRSGPFYSECSDGERCPYYMEIIANIAPQIRAKWDCNGYSWWIETDLDHAAFDILEDGEKYCRGIIIRLADLPE